MHERRLSWTDLQHQRAVVLNRPAAARLDLAKQRRAAGPARRCGDAPPLVRHVAVWTCKRIGRQHSGAARMYSWM